MSKTFYVRVPEPTLCPINCTGITSHSIRQRLSRMSSLNETFVYFKSSRKNKHPSTQQESKLLKVHLFYDNCKLQTTGILVPYWPPPLKRSFARVLSLCFLFTVGTVYMHTYTLIIDTCFFIIILNSYYYVH